MCVLTVNDLARQLEAFQSLVRSVNDRVVEQPRPHAPKQIRWWNRSLTNERKLVIRLRRRYRTVRRRADEAEIRQRKNELHLASMTYKETLCYTKNDHWKAFIADNRNDPWGRRVYCVCSSKSSRTDISCIKVGDILRKTWQS